jgi:hypothetical protein
MPFYEEALSRMDNEGGASRPSAILLKLAEPAALTDDSMPVADVEHPAETMSVYARLARRWDVRADEAERQGIRDLLISCSPVNGISSRALEETLKQSTTRTLATK